MAQPLYFSALSLLRLHGRQDLAFKTTDFFFFQLDCCSGLKGQERTEKFWQLLQAILQSSALALAERLHVVPFSVILEVSGRASFIKNSEIFHGLYL